MGHKIKGQPGVSPSTFIEEAKKMVTSLHQNNYILHENDPSLSSGFCLVLMAEFLLYVSLVSRLI